MRCAAWSRRVPESGSFRRLRHDAVGEYEDRSRETQRSVGKTPVGDLCETAQQPTGWSTASGCASASSRSDLRVRPGILLAGCEPYNSTQHEADHCKNDETDVATREVLVIFDNAPAAAEPAIRALNYPAFG